MCARASEGGPIWWELQAAARARAVAVAIGVGVGVASPPAAWAERCPSARLKAIQDAAVRNLGLHERPRWRARSRWAAALPVLTMRADRGMGWADGGTTRTAPIAVDHDQGAEIRLTWRLDRLIYDPSEPRLFEEERAARRARVSLDQEVTHLYFQWRRAAADAEDTEDGGDEGGEQLDEAETFAQLDALTGGWLGEQQQGACP